MPNTKACWMVAMLAALGAGCGGRTGNDGGSGGGSGGSGGGSVAQQPGAVCQRPQQDCAAGSTCELTRPGGTMEERCFTAECSGVTQSPCASGQRCDYVEGLKKCVPDGTLPEGAACTNDAGTCVRGTSCVVFPFVGGTGRCYKFCYGHGDCAAGKVCTYGGPIPNSLEISTYCGLPTQSCDLLAQDCGAGNRCSVAVLPDGGAIPHCFVGGTLADGAACSPGNWCQTGSLCGRGSEYGTCQKICNTDGGSPSCTSGSCTQAVPALPSVGTCL